MRSDILTKDLLELRDKINKLTNEQRDILLDLVDPLPEPQAEQKAVAKKSRKPRGKSARASSLAEQIKTTAGKVQDKLPADDWRTPCAKEGCELTADSAIHDVNSGYLGAHPFVSPSTAPTARNQSSASNGEAEQATGAGA